MNTDRFRFRVYDNINKRYDKWNDLRLIDKDGNLCYQDGAKYCNGQHPEDFTIEQCTGLRDRNGKLIYEGDVVKQTYKDGTNLCTEVFYNTELCRWYLRKPYPNLHAVEYMVWDFYGSMADSHEIIGNIHEDKFYEVTKIRILAQ